MNRYLSDEELNKLIAEMEQKPMYAPAHLQESVLWKLDEKEKKKQQVSAEISFFLYSVKMAVGMVAAMVLLFTIPARDGSDKSYASGKYRETQRIEQKLDVHLEQGKEKFSQISERLDRLMEQLFQRRDLGGFGDES